MTPTNPYCVECNFIHCLNCTVGYYFDEKEICRNAKINIQIVLYVIKPSVWSAILLTFSKMGVAMTVGNTTKIACIVTFMVVKGVGLDTHL